MIVKQLKVIMDSFDKKRDYTNLFNKYVPLIFENCNVLGYGVETLLMAGCKMSTSDRFGPPTVI
jgi:hypothetical protein